ncbi:MAG: aspartate aminotransferase family protein [Ruminococcaceae bacterium]|nr:aspartate aminotransferase family protein [Oscillospiraceae bacterium]
MNKDEIIALDSEYIAHTYGRLNLVPEKGKGSTLFDKDGKKYIDFTSGIGVNSLGIAPQSWITAVTEQLSKIQHISNYYYSEPTAKLAKTLVTESGMKYAIFQNCGAEANEAAIKVARKYSFDKYGEGRHTIITLVNSFHGRTITTLAATGQDVFHNYFFPFTEGFKYVSANDIDALKSALDGSVCAVMCEAVQGEGGVNILDSEYVSALAKICGEKDILLIFDEVQTGIGRTGKLFAHTHFDCKPDIVTLAKGLGAGLPIGCCLIGEKCADVLHPGDHGTTFGGNPAVCAGANVVLDTVLSDGFLDSVNEKGEYIKSKVLSFGLDCVKEVRGKGLMIGIQVTVSHKETVKKALEKGLMLLTAGKDVIRMLPPLNISYGEIDEGLEILRAVLSTAE